MDMCIQSARHGLVALDDSYMFRLIYWIVNTCNECAGYELVLIQSLGPLLCPQDPLLCPQGPLLSGVRLLQTNVVGWSGTNLHHRIAGFDDIILQTNVVGWSGTNLHLQTNVVGGLADITDHSDTSGPCGHKRKTIFLARLHVSQKMAKREGKQFDSEF